MSYKDFQKKYNRLNSAQKQAVDTVEGPVMVVAGPGTGKTQILTLRIANILAKTDTNPENILALTFTESGVSSMRKRLATIIGSEAYRVGINTFHGFCNNIIQNYPEEFTTIIGARHISEVEQITLIEGLIDTISLEYLKPFGDPYHYLKSVLATINNLKREGIGALQFEKNIEGLRDDFETRGDKYHEKGAHKGKMKADAIKEQKMLEKNKELAAIYLAYETTLHEKKYYDYSDMIMEVAKTLSQNQDLLLILQEQYQYILVDEHQDTNNAQNTILTILANFHPNPNLFVVGDEKQAIYRFQGASLENFLYFKTLYPGAVIINLQENYRSPQGVLDSAHSLFPQSTALEAKSGANQVKIGVVSLAKAEYEYYFLIEDIRTRLESGVQPQEIAVLYRDNRDASPLAGALEKASVPFYLFSDTDVLSDKEVKKLLLLLRLVYEFGSEELLIEALHIDVLKIHPLDIYKLIHYREANKDANGKRPSLYNVLKNENIFLSLDLESKNEIKTFYNNLVKWASKKTSDSAQETIETIMHDSGLLAHVLMKADTLEVLEKIMKLFEVMRSQLEAKKDANLKDFFEYIDTLETHDLSIKANPGAAEVNAVSLMTAHKSKGLEFNHVYIINCFNGHWGNKNKREKLPLPTEIFSLMNNKNIEHDENDDERRLFYVALTRAKKTVTISFTTQSTSGKEQLPSQFIDEIHEELKEKIDTSHYDGQTKTIAELLLTPAPKKESRIKDQEYIRSVFDEHGLSVTALNNYLSCPWQYFYNNLLRIPKAMTKHQVYGVAIHSSLKWFFDEYKTKDPGKDALIAKFLEFLDRQSLPEKEIEESKKRGQTALSGYYDSYDGTWIKDVKTEYDIQAVMLDDIRLTGKIDKIEILGQGRDVNVSDYKTSKPKSRNEIEGGTQNSNGDMKRQLVFYRILLAGNEKEKFNMISGEIDFIEPDDKGRYKKEQFEITDEEVEEVKALIRETATQIREGAFWDKRCDNKECEYCALRDMME